MTWASERWALLALLAVACGGESTAPAQHLSVRLRVVNAGCDAGRVTDFRAFEGLLLAPRSERSACATGRPQTFAAVGDTLAGKLSFRDLPEGPLTVKLLGYRDEACRADKLGLCGLAEVQLAPTVMELEVPVSCDDLAGAAFASCVAR